MIGFDEYDRRARLAPGLLAVAPVTILITTLGWAKYPALASLGGVLVAMGGGYLLALLVRSMGTSIQPSLWKSWDGAPTTRLLRLSDDSNKVLRAARRKAVQSISGVTLFSAAAEQEDPASADAAIEAAIALVSHIGRDDKYPLVFKENVNYGFERNFWATRWVGRAVSLACFAASLCALLFGGHTLDASEVSTNALAAGVFIEALFLIGWLALPSGSRTREAAERYADQLLRAVTAEHQGGGGS